jgi:hypothetical protein
MKLLATLVPGGRHANAKTGGFVIFIAATRRPVSQVPLMSISLKN